MGLMSSSLLGWPLDTENLFVPSPLSVSLPARSALASESLSDVVDFS